MNIFDFMVTDNETCDRKIPIEFEVTKSKVLVKITKNMYPCAN